ncbi:MAG: hypothetical protein AVDCRST_MAG89-5166, partial [uncultured Gemmatimonadetes bacterium]
EQDLQPPARWAQHAQRDARVSVDPAGDHARHGPARGAAGRRRPGRQHAAAPGPERRGVPANPQVSRRNAQEEPAEQRHRRRPDPAGHPPAGLRRDLRRGGAPGGAPRVGREVGRFAALGAPAPLGNEDARRRPRRAPGGGAAGRHRAAAGAAPALHRSPARRAHQQRRPGRRRLRLLHRRGQRADVAVRRPAPQRQARGLHRARRRGLRVDRVRRGL